MKFPATALLIAVSLCSAIASAETKTVTLQVEKWSCCGSEKTAAAVRSVPGVRAVEAREESKVMVVTFDDAKTNQVAIREAIQKSGARCDPKGKDGRDST